jgi:hypothetical protein
VLNFVKFCGDLYIRFVNEQPGLIVEMTETVVILIDHIERRTAYFPVVVHAAGYPRRVKVLATPWQPDEAGDNSGVFSIDLTPHSDRRPGIRHQMRWRRPGDEWLNMSVSVPVGSLADIDRNIPDALEGWLYLIHQTTAKAFS